MYICDFCNRSSNSGDPLKLTVTKWRTKIYENMTGEFKQMSTGKEAENVSKCCPRCSE